jgi:hypothetical protein
VRLAGRRFQGARFAYRRRQEGWLSTKRLCKSCVFRSILYRCQRRGRLLLGLLPAIPLDRQFVLHSLVKLEDL